MKVNEKGPVSDSHSYSAQSPIISPCFPKKIEVGVPLKQSIGIKVFQELRNIARELASIKRTPRMLDLQTPLAVPSLTTTSSVSKFSLHIFTIGLPSHF